MANKDLIGERFGRYVVIDVCPNDKRKVLCRCDCGNERFVDRFNLLGNKTHSCGCIKSEVTAKRNFKHGETGTRLYKVWSNMRRRCNDQTNNRYKNYGGKGVKVCDDWNDFETFKRWADKTGYDPDAEYGKCTIDRIDVDGDYEPNNCRWTNSKTQANNRSSNVLLTYNGETKHLKDWEEELGFKKDRVGQRLRRGWSVEKALSTPV